MTSPRWRVLAGLAAVVLVAAACGGSSKKPDITVGGKTPSVGLSAEVASYDLVVNRPGRFVVGLFANDNQRVLAYGSTEFRFSYLGTRAAPGSTPRPDMTSTAQFLPIPGQQHLKSSPTPQLVPGSEALGAYGAPKVGFDMTGFWEVTVTANTPGKQLSTHTDFEVAATSTLPGPGDPAPTSRQPLAGDAGASPTSIDSRAGSGEPIPDPELHNITVADALAKHEPIMLVVSTPTYCQSRFCGPITDAVAALARANVGRMVFIHLEIWKDFDKNLMNAAAAEWIFPKDTKDGREPWVFTVDRRGVIQQRFDNVATDHELADAVQRLLAP